MRLLVSVRDAVEAAEALAGGADVVDAKEPRLGALGPVRPDVLRSIARAVAGAAPLSAALGDWDADVSRRAKSAAGAGVTFVKIGFAGSPRTVALVQNLTVLVAAIRPASAMLVAYADHTRAAAPDVGEIAALAHETGAAGVLIDTFDKQGDGITALMNRTALQQFVCRAHAQRLVVALAGKLTAGDLTLMCDTGADVIGFRGAVCELDRTGIVTAARVRALRTAIDATKTTKG